MGGFDQQRLGRWRATLAAHVQGGAVPGLVAAVARGDEVHVEALGRTGYDGPAPMARDTIFRIASMSKPVTAVAALILLEESRLRLDDPVDDLLPELADRQVLRRPGAELDDTVPAERPITVRDLLTFTWGMGMVLAPPGQWPIQAAMAEQIGEPGPPRPGELPGPDEVLRRLGSLPLIHQPGTCWMYNTGADVLGVLIARASGRPFETFLQERVFGPLGMRDTGFSVPSADLGRLATSYAPDPRTGLPVVYDVADGQWSSPPAFPSGAGGLVSTVDDYLAFARMLLAGGGFGGDRILSRPMIELMTTDQLTTGQKSRTVWAPGYFDDNGWGFGVAVRTRRIDPASVGQYGWDGGLGTSWANDPREGLISVLLTQGMFTSAGLPPVVQDFWTGAYQAID